MADVREAVLVRLLALAVAVPGIVRAARNNASIGETSLDRPAIEIFDGEETASDDDPVRRRPIGQPRRINMTPRVYIMASDLPENVGTVLSGYRAKFVRAVLTDATLQTLLGEANGTIIYEGCATTTDKARSGEGEIQILLSFDYVLRPADL